MGARGRISDDQGLYPGQPDAGLVCYWHGAEGADKSVHAAIQTCRIRQPALNRRFPFKDGRPWMGLAVDFATQIAKVVGGPGQQGRQSAWPVG